MKAYKLKEASGSYKKGRIFCQNDNYEMLLANYTEPQQLVYSGTISTMIKQEKVDEIDLMNETKMHPHLYKPIRTKLFA